MSMDKEYQIIFSTILFGEYENLFKNKCTDLQDQFYDKVILPIKEFETREEIESLYWNMIGEIKEFYFEMGMIANSQIEKKYYEQHFGVGKNGR